MVQPDSDSVFSLVAEAIGLGGQLTHSVLFDKCRPSLASPGSAWLEGSVGTHLNLHMCLSIWVSHQGGQEKAAIVGVDPHKHVLSAVALDARGGVLGSWNGAMSAKSLNTLLRWAPAVSPGPSTPPVVDHPTFGDCGPAAIKRA